MHTQMNTTHVQAKPLKAQGELLELDTFAYITYAHTNKHKQHTSRSADGLG